MVAPSVRILGDDEPNTFGSTSCFAKLDGNGGDDYLASRPRFYFEAYAFDCVASSRMHGRCALVPMSGRARHRRPATWNSNR